VQKEIKSWSFLEEISKPSDETLKSSENVLSIWPKLREERKKRRGRRDVRNRENLKGPRDVGEEIKRNLRDSDLIMIEEGTSIHGVGYITFSLSREWMAKSIHKMLKDGIDTWAPELPVERVFVQLFLEEWVP
ncbi:arginine--tRNA ligase, chloroplastic/mitochondrial, partial [Tanacetum coccineum]